MNATVLIIAIVAVVVLAAAAVATMSRRTDRGAATGLLARETVKRDRSRRRQAKADPIVAAPPPPSGRAVEKALVLSRAGGDVELRPAPGAPAVLRAPMDAEQLGVTRRQFLNRSTIAMFTAGLGGFGAAVLAFLWPSLSGGFGSKVTLGKVSDVLAEIAAKKEPKYFAEARTYLTAYPKEDVDKAKKVYAPGVVKGMESGVAALYQKCVHLGCKVPWCTNSQWFECPCHGSQYNRVGEYKAGPAPRGLDRFDVVIDGAGNVTVDTSQVRIGPAQGTNTTGQEAEGPHCVGGKGGGH